MSDLHPVRMPDRFYLPRCSRFGFEIRDVMPVEEAVAYVTDGVRFGVQLRCGRTRWFLRPMEGSLRADDYWIDADALPAGLADGADPRDLVRWIWRENHAVWNPPSADVHGVAV